MTTPDAPRPVWLSTPSRSAATAIPDALAVDAPAEAAAPAPAEREPERPRMSAEEIRLGYRLLLDRDPGPAEIERMAQVSHDARGLRRVFLNSAEFERLETDRRARRAAAAPVVLIHLHIPKSAGTSLTSILARNFKPEQNLSLDGAQVDRLGRMPAPERDRLRFIFGHLAHGVGRHLTHQRAVYVCALRRPGPRLLSYYRYMRRREDHPMHAVLTGQDMTFGAFLEHCAASPNQRIEVDNGQIRRLAGLMTPEHLGREHEVFQQALANILAPDMVFGLTERFETLVEDLVVRGLIQPTPVVVENAAPETGDIEAARAALTPHQQDILRAFTGWDDFLYDICEVHRFGPTT